MHILEVSEKGAFYYINHHNLCTFFGPGTLKAHHFQANWGRKELYTSKESPMVCQLKADVKLEESLSWEAPDEI